MQKNGSLNLEGINTKNNKDELVAVDTNVLVYAQTMQDPVKKVKALELLKEHRPIVASRVVFEFLYVIRREHNFLDVGHEGIFDLCFPILDYCKIQPVTMDTIRYAKQLIIDLKKIHPLQIFDAIILAASVEAGCTVLYSEDMRDGLQEKQLSVVNPFKTN
jgi:predicted nucleic acid-binding protein